MSYNIQYDRFTARVNQVEQEGRVLWWTEWDYYVTCRGTAGETSIARAWFPS
ncbi:MAG: hypothetical protein JNJ77_09610 [Planctomycetia bacterium]|nr:hypothetical protein [Planctomycetia bacterium]